VVVSFFPKKPRDVREGRTNKESKYIHFLKPLHGYLCGDRSFPIPETGSVHEPPDLFAVDAASQSAGDGSIASDSSAFFLRVSDSSLVLRLSPIGDLYGHLNSKWVAGDSKLFSNRVPIWGLILGCLRDTI
jgi:hypothetical protein